MKAWLIRIAPAVLAASLAVLADSTDDEYVHIYNQIQQGDDFAQGGRASQARQRYQAAREALESLQKREPTWNPRVVEFRLRYLADKLAALPAEPAPAPEEAGVQPAPAARGSEPVAELTALQERVRQLEADKILLAARLREALAGQPAALDPRELAKAEEKIKSQQKEIELLRGNQRPAEAESPERAGPDALESGQEALAQARQELAAQSEKLATLTREKEGLQTLLQSFTRPEDAQALREENTRLRAQVEELRLPRDTAAGVEDLQRRLVALQTALGEERSRAELLQAEKQVLEKRMSELVNSGIQDRAVEFGLLTNELTSLKARLDTLEARKAPYSPEELALFKAPPLAAPRSSRRRDKVPKADPAAVSSSWTASVERDRAQPRAGRGSATPPDEPPVAGPDVSALANLAATQIEQKQLTEAEATLKQALATSPRDADSLSLLGRLRYQQDRIDEALEALSLSAQLGPQNAETFNYLGLTLSRKGLRDPAESALRRAVQLSPAYGSAHRNLAVVYAAQKPPSIELARHHYQKARAMGVPADAQLERLLAGAGATDQTP